MYKITIEEMDGYRYLVDFGHKVIADQFKIWFQSSTTVSQHSREWDSDEGRYKGKRKFWKELVPHYESVASKSVEPQQVVILRGMIDWLLHWKALGPGKEMGVSFNPMDYMSMEKPFLLYPDAHKCKVTLHEKWEKIFRGHPRGQFYVEAQLEAWKCLVSCPHASVELGTGLGKTELILALVDHFAGSCIPEDEDPLDGGNIAILVPGNAIRDEINLRGLSIEEARKKGLTSVNHWDVHVTWNDWSPENRVNIINPVGFMNSKQAMNPRAIQWLRNVKKVIIDEAHKLSSDSYERLFQDYMINVISSKAFSGTLDKLDARYLHPSKCTPESMQPCNAQVVGYSGSCKISKKVMVDTSVYQVLTSISDKEKYDQILEWEDRTAKEAHFLDKLNCLVEAEKYPEVIKKIWEHVSLKHNDTRAPLYIPFYGKDENLDLAERLVELGIDVCWWASGRVWLNGELVGSSVEDVKRLAESKAYQILMTSSVAFEGADLKGLKAVLTTVGSNNSRTQQPIGRSARGDKLDIYLISDENNSLLSRQTKSRLKRIMSLYNVEHYEKLDWRKEF
ncbi:P-loop containing nucleoside triphosphate hydrolase [Vibrio phage Va2]|nr:P-loop containing nucleoside triphosphate hydrolase [Vibrio phage Va2]